MWLISQRLSVHAPKVHRALLLIVSPAESHSKLPLETIHLKEHRRDRAITLAKGAAVVEATTKMQEVVVEIAEVVAAITTGEVAVAPEAIAVVAAKESNVAKVEVEMAAQTTAKVSR